MVGGMLVPKARPKGQHFLLSSQARDLPIVQIARLTEPEAESILSQARWGDLRKCPFCDHEKHYRVSDRPGWRCAGCRKQFTVTSGTSLHCMKMSKANFLLAVALYCQESKGKSALSLSLQLGCAYKTAYVLLHKIREQIAIESETLRIGGEVEIDGATFGGKIVKTNNRKVHGAKRRLLWHYRDRQVIVVARQRGGRTKTWVVKRESQAIMGLLRTIAADSTIFCDYAHAWDELGKLYKSLRINHSEAYATAEANTNLAESFHSIVRRAEYGVYHRITGRWLSRYAAEVAWRQDHRRKTSREKFDHIVKMMICGNKSIEWSGYWKTKKKSAPLNNNIVRLPAINVGMGMPKYRAA